MKPVYQMLYDWTVEEGHWSQQTPQQKHIFFARTYKKNITLHLCNSNSVISFALSVSFKFASLLDTTWQYQEKREIKGYVKTK